MKSNLAVLFGFMYWALRSLLEARIPLGGFVVLFMIPVAVAAQEFSSSYTVQIDPKGIGLRSQSIPIQANLLLENWVFNTPYSVTVTQFTDGRLTFSAESRRQSWAVNRGTSITITESKSTSGTQTFTVGSPTGTIAFQDGRGELKQKAQTTTEGSSYEFIYSLGFRVDGNVVIACAVYTLADATQISVEIQIGILDKDTGKFSAFTGGGLSPIRQLSRSTVNPDRAAGYTGNPLLVNTPLSNFKRGFAAEGVLPIEANVLTGWWVTYAYPMGQLVIVSVEPTYETKVIGFRPTGMYRQPSSGDLQR